MDVHRTEDRSAWGPDDDQVQMSERGSPALALLLVAALAPAANAAPAGCRDAIVAASARFTQATVKALAACARRHVAACDSDPRTVAARRQCERSARQDGRASSAAAATARAARPTTSRWRPSAGARASVRTSTGVTATGSSLTRRRRDVPGLHRTRRGTRPGRGDDGPASRRAPLSRGARRP